MAKFKIGLYDMSVDEQRDAYESLMNKSEIADAATAQYRVIAQKKEWFSNQGSPFNDEFSQAPPSSPGTVMIYVEYLELDEDDLKNMNNKGTIRTVGRESLLGRDNSALPGT
jgi:hypothetical protein